MEVIGVETMTAILQVERTTASLWDVTMVHLVVLGMNETASVGQESLGTTNPHRKCVHDILLAICFQLRFLQSIISPKIIA